MLITDFASLVAIIKDILPFTVCILAFVGSLYLYKVALKTDRRNPLIYLLSVISVIGLYFSFIKVCGLRRTDYFLDGFTLFMEQFEGVISYGLIIAASIFSIIRCIDFSFLMVLLSCILGFITTLILYAEYIILTVESLYTYLVDTKNKLFDFIRENFVSKCYAFNHTRSFICVFNC